MRKFLVACLALVVCGVAWSQTYYANYLAIQQRDNLNTGWNTRFVAPPIGTGDGIMIYDRATNLPKYVKVGDGLAVASGALEVSGLFDGAWSSLTGVPSTFSPVAHTHTVSDITDFPVDLGSFGNGPGYVTSSALFDYATTAAMTSALAGKENTGSAATAQAYAVQRANHTGTQSVKTIAGNAVVGTTVKTGAIQIYKSAAVASGVAVFNLTEDDSTGGNALCSEVFSESVQVTVNDAAVSYQYGWVFSNSDKTLTVTANKFTTANTSTGELNQVPADGAIVRLSVGCAAI